MTNAARNAKILAEDCAEPVTYRVSPELVRAAFRVASSAPAGSAMFPLVKAAARCLLDAIDRYETEPTHQHRDYVFRAWRTIRALEGHR